MTRWAGFLSSFVAEVERRQDTSAHLPAWPGGPRSFSSAFRPRLNTSMVTTTVALETSAPAPTCPGTTPLAPRSPAPRSGFPAATARNRRPRVSRRGAVGPVRTPAHAERPPSSRQQTSPPARVTRAERSCHTPTPIAATATKLSSSVRSRPRGPIRTRLIGMSPPWRDCGRAAKGPAPWSGAQCYTEEPLGRITRETSITCSRPATGSCTSLCPPSWEDARRLPHPAVCRPQSREVPGPIADGPTPAP